MSGQEEGLGKYTVNKLIDFFRSFEPAKSKLELSILERIYNEESNVHNNETSACTSYSHSYGQHYEYTGEALELASLEERLKSDLFIAGDEDKKVFETLKGKVVNKTQYPNVYKWLKLLAKSQ